ncbi:ATP synthase subunit s, mitochondrial [Melipona quadrifasciata]|uniref:ATP synthase subunit s, mitochondrial n=1 Tax=Melipona quadrifasciata TaxID=166423 RepID=A0A0M9A610_9HYME|nr:ATP synthase subunit s, mitochondrial [Melipona quadrifasciata]
MLCVITQVCFDSSNRRHIQLRNPETIDNVELCEPLKYGLSLTSVSNNVHYIIIHTLSRLIPLIQNTKSQARPFFYWLVVVFNRVDAKRIKEIGPDRACAEWLLKNGAYVRWKNFTEPLTDYNALPASGSYYIEAIEANDAGICDVGFPYLDSLTNLEIINCKSVDENGLHHLKVLKNLKQLKIRGLPAITDSVAHVELVKALPNCSGKDCRIVVQKLNLMKEHENQENVSFNSNSSNDNYTNDYTQQPKSNINVENKWAKYLDKPEEIDSDIFKASSSKDNSQIGTDHPEYSDDSTMCDWSQNKHTNIDKDVSYEKDLKQDFIYDNEQEYDNFVSEKIDNVSDSDNNSKNVNESTENIFDDNEDFDITIDF